MTEKLNVLNYFFLLYIYIYYLKKSKISTVLTNGGTDSIVDFANIVLKTAILWSNLDK